MTRNLRACVVCGRPSAQSRCELHRLPTRHRRYAENAKIVRSNAITCHLCGKPFTDPSDPPVADHVIARAHGETDELDNLKPAHRSCNGRRGQALAAEWNR